MTSKKKQTQTLNKSDFYDLRFTEKQKLFQETIRDSTITICQGSAGSSKTFTSCYTALKLLSENQVNKIILIKNCSEVGNSMGHLPGTIEEKMNVHFLPYIDNINQIIPKQTTGFLLSSDEIILQPAQFVRGLSFRKAVILVDESQNLTIEELMAIITRIGEGSKLIICGDVSQHDIATRLVALPTIGKLLDGISHEEHKVSFFEFTPQDVVRHPLLIKITETYEQWKYSEDGKKSGLFKK